MGEYGDCESRDFCDDARAERDELKAENERLRAALKPFADELDNMEAQGAKPPPERMLMFASEGGGTFFGLQVKAMYDARAAYQQKAACKMCGDSKHVLDAELDTMVPCPECQPT